MTTPSLIADVQVVPSPTGTAANEYEHVDAAIRAISHSGLSHTVNALGTVIDGPADLVWATVRKAFEATLSSGATKELMYLKIYSGRANVNSLLQSGRAASAGTSKPAAAGWAPQASTAGGGQTKAGRKRVCFQLHFNSTELQEYLEEHERVWPEMQQALVECGWHNYSLFYREDGYAIGYFETDDSFETACKRMDARAVNTKWQKKMSKYTASGNVPLVGAAELKHYFYLGEDRADANDFPAKSASADSAAGAAAASTATRSLNTTVSVAVAFAAGMICGLALARSR